MSPPLRSLQVLAGSFRLRPFREYYRSLVLLIILAASCPTIPPFFVRFGSP